MSVAVQRGLPTSARTAKFIGCGLGGRQRHSRSSERDPRHLWRASVQRSTRRASIDAPDHRYRRYPLTRLIMGERPTLARPDNARPRLDFGWAASNGPTGGYLASLRLDANPRGPTRRDRGAQRRGSSVLRLAERRTRYARTSPSRPARPASPLASLPSTNKTSVRTASVDFKPVPSAVRIPTTGRPPGALPPEAYAELAEHRLNGPPVMGQFVYRPTTDPDGQSPKPGWDLDGYVPCGRCQGEAASRVSSDSWYPPNPRVRFGTISLATPNSPNANGKSSPRFHRLPAPEDGVPEHELCARR